MSLLDTASLIVTPNGYKEGKLYSVIPSDGSGDLSVTRATTATRVNSQGLVELVPYNLLSYSSSFVTAPWQSNATRTANAATAPDGTMTATRVQFASGSAQYLYQGAPDIASGTATISCWIKGATAQKIGFNDGNTIGNSINITTEWVRYEFTLNTNGVDLGLQFDNYFGVSPAQQAKDFYIWGAQLVEGSTALPYQKTETRLNIPRLDYSNGTCPSILVEPQRTNLWTYSEDFNAGTINSSLITYTANTTETTAPNGTNTADKFEVTTSGGDAFRRFTRTIAVQNFSLSLYVKGAAGQKLQLFLARDSFAELKDIQTTLNGEWQRIVLNDSFSTTSSTVVMGVEFGFTSSDSVAGQIYYLWGAQLEVGSYPTSYIPTTSASVTRNADVISKTGISSLIGQTEGTMFVDIDFDANKIDSGSILIPLKLYQSSTKSELVLYSDGRVQVTHFNLGTLTCNIDLPSYGLTNGNHKIAFGYKANDFVLYIDGSLAGTDTSGTVGAQDSISLKDTTYPSATNENAVALWKTRLTNAQLATLTTI